MSIRINKSVNLRKHIINKDISVSYYRGNTLLYRKTPTYCPRVTDLYDTTITKNMQQGGQPMGWLTVMIPNLVALVTLTLYTHKLSESHGGKNQWKFT